MANGFAPYLLEDIAKIAKSATPQNKIEMPGFLQSLLTAHSYGNSNIKYDLMNGHFNAVQVKKKKRYTAANGLMSAVNSDLLTLAFANLGKNRRTGLTTASTINIGKDTNFNSLTDGATQILSDYKLNNMSGKPIAVGAGLFNNYIMQQAAKQTAQNGLDTRTQAGGFDFFYDNEVETIGDPNDLLVYEKDAVQLVTYLKYQGFKKRDLGTAIFDNVKIPYTTMTANGGIQVAPMPVDVQFKFNDCEADYTVDGETETLQKGWNMILSLNFGLWTIPSTAYRTEDPLTGNRGSLLYNVTNDCDSCDGGY